MRSPRPIPLLLPHDAAGTGKSLSAPKHCRLLPLRRASRAPPHGRQGEREPSSPNVLPTQIDTNHDSKPQIHLAGRRCSWRRFHRLRGSRTAAKQFLPRDPSPRVRTRQRGAGGAWTAGIVLFEAGCHGADRGRRRVGRIRRRNRGSAGIGCQANPRECSIRSAAPVSAWRPGGPTVRNLGVADSRTSTGLIDRCVGRRQDRTRLMCCMCCTADRAT